MSIITGDSGGIGVFIGLIRWLSCGSVVLWFGLLWFGLGCPVVRSCGSIYSYLAMSTITGDNGGIGVFIGLIRWLSCGSVLISSVVSVLYKIGILKRQAVLGGQSDGGGNYTGGFGNGSSGGDCSGSDGGGDGGC